MPDRACNMKRYWANAATTVLMMSMRRLTNSCQAMQSRLVLAYPRSGRLLTSATLLIGNCHTFDRLYVRPLESIAEHARRDLRLIFGPHVSRATLKAYAGRGPYI